jgi:acyl-CoA synthetase (AMP-forming)/AMP-acid ligase II
MQLRELLDAGAADRLALRQLDRLDISYARMRADVDALARALQARGIGVGDRIAISLANGPKIVLAFFGVACARAVAAPLNPAYTRDEYTFYLQDIGPKALVVAPGGAAPLAREATAALNIPVIELTIDERGRLVLDGVLVPLDAPPAAPLEEDVALFLHTSGTTSRPKGVPLTHRNLTTSAANIVRWYRIAPRDVSLCVMPLFHVHGLVFSTLATLLAGATEIVPERFSASAFWRDVRRSGATIVSAVPTIYRTLLLRADADNAPGPGEHRLRFLRSSSAALPVTEMLRLEARFGVPVIEAYSMTEASHQMCANPLDGERRPGSVGVGAFVEVRIMDEAGNFLPPGVVGEVVVRGENVTSGYHNNPQADAAAFVRGWFRTGDCGMLDELGYVTLAGRIKETINRGGEKISPLEVDEALLSYPGVIDAVAYARPDEKYGETVAAALVLRAGVTPEEVLAHVRTRLASFKVPSVVHVTDAIPKTATGKVQRRHVAEALDGPAALAGPAPVEPVRRAVQATLQ